ncbi:MAG: hypothetical protein HND39_01760 [Ignavibacteriota bacterium]|jgi:hypothetical protein|nr:hypothetical protein [Ignavibacteriota bacterium]MCC7094940.1 hypothetical protein [Ignavibacteriaceae bacterium]MCE7856235.1 hypothetical protein [Ignavibacteria bacterium CHB3]MEB2297669.1 hypothetical protein [Ignavibacteria bacterium]NUM61293.1 hypothetical protein [Ignavibacteriaceae bacterium]
MKVTTLPEQGKESKGFISSHEIVNKTDLVNRSLVQGVVKELEEKAVKLGADCISNLKLKYLAVPSGFGLELVVVAEATAIKL